MGISSLGENRIFLCCIVSISPTFIFLYSTSHQIYMLLTAHFCWDTTQLWLITGMHGALTNYSMPPVLVKLLWKIWVKVDVIRTQHNKTPTVPLYTGVKDQFSPKSSHPIARPLGRGMGCILYVKLRLILHYSHCSDVCNSMPYWTSL